MQEPSPRTSRLAIAGGLAGAIVIGSVGFLLGQATAPAPPAPRPAPAATPSPVPSPTSAPIPATIDRAELLALANSAADAAASGAQLPAANADAAGRRFDLVLPFGCDGPSDRNRLAGMGWHYDAQTETLRIRVHPARWDAAEWMLADKGDGEASLEGFWISRPWSSAERCPASSAAREADSRPVLLPGQTLAVARWVNKGADSAGRPFQTVQRMAPGGFDPARGFHLRILGRIDPQAGEAAIRCIQPAGSAQRPLCLVAASFTEIRIENPVDGKVIAAWPMSDELPRAD